jgi:predicted nucleotidyltransferase
LLLGEFAMGNGIVLESDERARLVADLLRELTSAFPGSEALLRGSLAEGRADLYSDIDLLWDVPDTAFSAAIAALPLILKGVRPVASLRFDPDFQYSAKRRLAFIRFAGVPLFWRVDLDVFARSVDRDPDYDRDNPSARGTSWSFPESSLANVIAAIKAQRRGRDNEAAELLARAEARVGIASPEVDLQRRIGLLLDTVAAKDPTTASLAADIRRLVTEST